MKRRSFVKSVAVGTAGIPFFGKAVVRNASARPNVLIIHTDQQAPWTLGAYGGTLVDTPNIDSIGRDGAVFNSFFCDSAVCTPSRGCFLSGLYAYNHGAFGNDEPLRPSVETFAHVLQRNGYDTGYIGKWHLDGPPALTGEMVGKDASGCPVWIPPDRAMGFSDSRYMFECWHGKKFVDRPGQKPEAFIYREIGDEKTYTTDWLAQKTIDFLRKERTNPFCCMVSIPDPHTPFWTRTPYSTQYKPEDMPLPETLEVPEFMPMAQTKEIQATFMTTQAARYQKPVEQLLREWKGQYCGMAKCIDDSVGRNLDCLKEQGQLDNTVIV
ncbi:MAG: sulfatase-like hydrolase/transferase, partial [Kiritimatiellales bacterium]